MSDTPSATILTARFSLLRRVAIIVIIVSLSLTALVGIVSLLEGTFGPVQGKVMLSTLVIGIVGVLALCNLAVVGGRFRWVGYVGMLAILLGLGLSLVSIWSASPALPDVVGQTQWIAVVVGVSLSQANLLLPLAEHHHSSVRAGLTMTLGAIAALALLLILLILSVGEVGTETFARLVGVAAILDVLGTIVVPVMGALLRDRGRPVTVAEPLVMPLPPELEERVTEAAAAAGLDRAEFARRAFEKALGEERTPTEQP